MEKITVQSKNLQECRNKFRAREFDLSRKGFNFNKSYPKNNPIGGVYVGRFNFKEDDNTGHTKYYTKDGKQIPSVTTILKRTMPSNDALMTWSNSLGFRRINYKSYMEEITSVGTIVHSIIEYYTKSQKTDIDSTDIDILFDGQPYYNKFRPMVFNCFTQFMYWFNNFEEFKVHSNELKLTSEEMEFGGTIDMIATIDGKLSIVDLKTSNNLDAKMPLQLAAYALLYDECHDNKIEQACILRMDKEDSSLSEFLTVDIDTLNKFKEHFLRLIEKYEESYILEEDFFEMLESDDFIKYSSI